VKRNIHIISAMSPMNPDFRTFLRNFPSLVNCMTIDFFKEWPREALQGVSKTQLEKNEFLGDQREQVSMVMGLFHKAVETTSTE